MDIIICVYLLFIFFLPLIANDFDRDGVTIVNHDPDNAVVLRM